MTYIESDDLSRDPAFIGRVKMAATSAAVDIMAEASSAAGHVLRASYAHQVLTSPESAAAHLATVICASDGAITAGTSDAALKTAVSSVWNAVAGYSAN